MQHSEGDDGAGAGDNTPSASDLAASFGYAPGSEGMSNMDMDAPASPDAIKLAELFTLMAAPVIIKSKDDKEASKKAATGSGGKKPDSGSGTAAFNGGKGSGKDTKGSAAAAAKKKKAVSRDDSHLRSKR